MDKNLNVYNSKQVVQWYDRLQVILPVEQLFFEEHKLLLETGTVLDIGIGGGRTTAYLMDKCKTYTGIDYSRNFIASVKNKYPDADCRVMDARDLSGFQDHQFDLVNFSLNGMDYVDLEGRKKIVSEAARVLKPGGLFFFSTHNKAHRYFNVDPWLFKEDSAWTNIKTFLKLLPFLGNKFMNKRSERIHEAYAIINDSAHNYNLMTFYTSPQFLREQIHHAGFTEVDFLTRTGQKVNDAELEEWIFVSSRKA